MRPQQSVQPDPIPSCLEAARYIYGPAQLGRSARAQFRNQRQQRRRVASFDAVQPRFLGAGQARCDKP
jgi:hypothetical protein